MGNVHMFVRVCVSNAFWIYLLGNYWQFEFLSFNRLNLYWSFVCTHAFVRGTCNFPFFFLDFTIFIDCRAVKNEKNLWNLLIFSWLNKFLIGLKNYFLNKTVHAHVKQYFQGPGEIVLKLEKNRLIRITFVGETETTYKSKRKELCGAPIIG